MENGTIFSASTVLAGPSQEPIHDAAVYVTDGRVQEVGPASEIRRAHPNARVIDATGATILPGLTDAHAHLYGLGLALDEVDLVATNSFDEVIARVAARYPHTAAADAAPAFDGNGRTLTHVLDPQFDPHPNDAGHRLIADAFEEALKHTR